MLVSWMIWSGLLKTRGPGEMKEEKAAFVTWISPTEDLKVKERKPKYKFSHFEKLPWNVCCAVF